MSILVVDLSHHNIIPESLYPAYDFGVRGLIHKATEGVTFTDPKVKARHHLVYRMPILWGVYHFIRPGNVYDQAKYFITQSRPYTDYDTLFACDYEDSNVSLEDVLLFMRLVEEETKRAPVLYSGHVLKEKMEQNYLPKLTQYRLWLAQYSDEAELPKGWTEYWLWQYTDKGEVPGITPPTDLNKYDYNEDDLRIEWAGREEEDEAPSKTVRVIAPKGVEVIVEYEGE